MRRGLLLALCVLILSGCSTSARASATVASASLQAVPSVGESPTATPSPPTLAARPTAVAPAGGMGLAPAVTTATAAPASHATIEAAGTAGTAIGAGAASPEAVALAYLQALQWRRWAQMWELMHPLARAHWSGEPAFAAFLSARFAPAGASTVASVSVGDSTSLAAWDDVRFVTRAMPAVRVQAQVRLAANAPYAVPPTDRLDKQPMILAQDGGRWAVVDGGPADLQGPVLVPGKPVVRRLRVPIMMYHHIAPEPVRTAQMGDYDYRLALDLTVTPQAFATQLDWLAAHGYQTITLPQLMAALYDGVALPAHPIILSFDDGYLDNAQYAGPALFQRHMVGTFNVITGLVGSTHGLLQYMSWEQIGELAAEGMPIESHTVFHSDLGTLTDLQAQTELVDSRQTITQHLGEPPQFICYPSGEPYRSGTVAAQRRITTFVTQDGYVGGLLDPKVAGAIQSSTAPDELTRIRVAGQESLSQFVASIEGQPGP